MNFEKKFLCLFAIGSYNSDGLWHARRVVRLEEIYLDNQRLHGGLVIGRAASILWGTVETRV